MKLTSILFPRGVRPGGSAFPQPEPVAVDEGAALEATALDMSAVAEAVTGMTLVDDCTEVLSLEDAVTEVVGLAPPLSETRR